MAEFEYDSNAVACPWLHPGRAGTRDQDRALAGSAPGREKYLNPSCAEIRIRIDVSSDTCLHRELLYSTKRCESARLVWTGRKKYSNFSTDRHEPDATMPLSYGI